VCVEISYVFSEIFCIIINLTCKQPAQLARNFRDSYLDLPFSATESGTLILELHCSTMLAVFYILQNMMLGR
jgi:hypothetical protein